MRVWKNRSKKEYIVKTAGIKIWLGRLNWSAGSRFIQSKLLYILSVMYVYRVQYFAELKHTSTHKSSSFFFIKQKQMKVAKLESFLRIYTNFFSFSCCLSSKLYPTLCDPMGCPWDLPGKNTGVGCHFLLQGIFPIQGSNRQLRPCLLHCRRVLYRWATGEALISVDIPYYVMIIQHHK